MRRAGAAVHQRAPHPDGCWQHTRWTRRRRCKCRDRVTRQTQIEVATRVGGKVQKWIGWPKVINQCACPKIKCECYNKRRCLRSDLELLQYVPSKVPVSRVHTSQSAKHSVKEHSKVCGPPQYASSVPRATTTVARRDAGAGSGGPKRCKGTASA